MIESKLRYLKSVIPAEDFVVKMEVVMTDEGAGTADLEKAMAEVYDEVTRAVAARERKGWVYL